MIETFWQREIGLLMAVGLIAVPGNWALYAALPVFVYEESGSTFLAGVLWAIGFPSNSVVSPVAGVLVDR